RRRGFRIAVTRETKSPAVASQSSDKPRGGVCVPLAPREMQIKRQLRTQISLRSRPRARGGSGAVAFKELCACVPAASALRPATDLRAHTHTRAARMLSSNSAAPSPAASPRARRIQTTNARGQIFECREGIARESRDFGECSTPEEEKEGRSRHSWTSERGGTLWAHTKSRVHRVMSLAAG
ncbi:Hypothetical predicted protein, partial [Olea europaea subsp. europaea]